MTAPLDLGCGGTPLGPPAPMQPTLLGCGVAPLSHCPWPQAWGSSSRPPPLTSGVCYVVLGCLFIASNFTSIPSHIHNWVLFLLWLHLFVLFGVISPLVSSSILVTCRLGEFIFQCPVFLPLHTVYGVLKASGLLIPSPVDHSLSELSNMTCLPWMSLHIMAHSLIELYKAVVHVIRLVGLMWLWVSFSLPSAGEG